MTNTTQQGYEEIDLIELLIKIYKFFKKRYLLILFCIVISAVLGVLSNFLLFKPRYQSTMIISSRSLTASEVAGIISTLDAFAYEENTEELAKLLNIPEKLAKKIEKIEAMPNREFQKNVEKDFRKDSTIAIKLEVTESDNWKTYEKGIVSYLENIPYVKMKTALYKESQERLLQQVQKEIKHLDSLKKIIEAGGGKAQFILNNSTQVYTEILKLYEKENEIKENLFFVNDIRVIKEFTNYKKPKKFSVKEVTITFALIGFIIGIVVSLIIELNKIIRKREGRE
jgi:capsular polysaccharide biosynthesis protein